MAEAIDPTVRRKFGAFKRRVWRHYRESGREFPWRATRDPYSIVVSEIMLQQTQTARVAQRYHQFLERFPDFKSLARAPMSSVLKEWQGLGYNRRAVFLKRLAEAVHRDLGGKLPRELEELRKLPGIGPYTAGAIRAFVFGERAVFIETNIRSVFLHHFFSAADRVTDREIAALVEATVDKQNPREWYYALMDYGVSLKRSNPRINAKSAHYVRQSAFKGSVREVRGAILRAITTHGALTRAKLRRAIQSDSKRFDVALEGLLKEKILNSARGRISVD